MKRIIIDTNFLLIPGNFKLDIFSEMSRIADFQYEFFIIDKTIDELNYIINDHRQKMKDRLYAKIGLGLIEKKNIKKIESKGLSVDDAIVENSDKDTIVATADKELKKRLKEKGIKTIALRKKQFLVFV